MRRCFHARFREPILSGRKDTTIRPKPLPVGEPIMAFQWLAKPYRSKQAEIGAIKVLDLWSIAIEHQPDGRMRYSHGMESSRELWEHEGFRNREDMDAWFRAVVPQGEIAVMFLHKFQLMNGGGA